LAVVVAAARITVVVVVLAVIVAPFLEKALAAEHQQNLR
jgi:hypothetical protein